MFNMEHRQILNKNGDLFLKGQDSFYPEFKTFEEAVKYKDQLLKTYIYAGVTIANLKTNEVSEDYFHEKFANFFIKEKHEYQNWVNLPFYKRIFVKKPITNYYDGKH